MSMFGALIEFLYITPFIILFPDLFNINVSVLCSNTAKVLLYNSFVMFQNDLHCSLQVFVQHNCICNGILSMANYICSDNILI